MACLEELLKKKPRRGVDAGVAVDAHPCVEELWELGPEVTEHRHHRPRTLRPRLSKEHPSEANLSRTRHHHHHLTWWR
jgi:hypothetical protein